MKRAQESENTRRIQRAPRSGSDEAGSQTATTHPHNRPEIDSLRALAVLVVVGFHAFPAAVPGGYVRVDVFFVISGYLITGIVVRDLAAGRNVENPSPIRDGLPLLRDNGHYSVYSGDLAVNSFAATMYQQSLDTDGN